MRILVLQLKRIGDLILTTPALWSLRQNLPKAHIALAVEAGSREMLPAIDYIDELPRLRAARGEFPPLAGMAPPGLASRLHSLPPILHRQIQSSV